MARVALRSHRAQLVSAVARSRRVSQLGLLLVACNALICSALICTPAALAQVAVPNETLVPAQFKSVTDQLGFVWDLHSYGFVRYGTNRIFNGAAVLQINGSTYSATSSLMTADGTRYVLSGSSGPIQITRHIRQDTKNGTVRYVDSFLNTTASPAQARVTVYSKTTLTNSQLLSDRGKPAGNSLRDGQYGMVAISQTPGKPAALFFLGSNRGRVKPTIHTVSANEVRIDFLLTLPPRQRVSIIHGLAQRNLKNPPTAAKLSAKFAVFRSSNWIRDLPRDLRKTIGNIDPRRLVPNQPPGGFGDAIVVAIDALGVDISKDADILVMDEGTVLSGSVEGEEVTVETRHGRVQIPTAEVAVLIGGAGVGRSTGVLLRNGEILNGPVRAEGFHFASDSGITVALNAEQLGAIVMRSGQRDGVPADGVSAFIKTYRGDRFAVRFPPDATIECATPWFPLVLPCGEIVYLAAAREPQPIHSLTTRDGSRLAVILPTGEIALNTVRFGTVRLPIASIREWTRAERRESSGADAPDDVEQEPAGSYFELAGDCRVAGTMVADKIDVLTGAGTVVLPIDDLQRFERDDAASGANVFSFELVNGNTISGRMPTPSVKLRALGGVREVPTRHLVAFERPLPQPPPGAEQAVPKSESSDEAPAAKEKKPVNPFGGGGSADPLGGGDPDPFGGFFGANDDDPFG